MQGNEVVVTYAKVRDRLRYVAKLSLSEVGATGNAPALKPVGEADPKSRIGAAILWKAPHEFKLKPPEQPPARSLGPGPRRRRRLPRARPPRGRSKAR